MTYVCNKGLLLSFGVHLLSSSSRITGLMSLCCEQLSLCLSQCNLHEKD